MKTGKTRCFAISVTFPKTVSHQNLLNENLKPGNHPIEVQIESSKE